MRELISFWIASSADLIFVIVWLTYGIFSGFKNWVLWTCYVFLKVFGRSVSWTQSDFGKILDALFLVSGVAFVLYKYNVFNF